MPACTHSSIYRQHPSIQITDQNIPTPEGCLCPDYQAAVSARQKSSLMADVTRNGPSPNTKLTDRQTDRQRRTSLHHLGGDDGLNAAGGTQSVSGTATHSP